MSKSVDTYLKLGKNEASPENELVVAGVDLLKLCIVRSISVRASVGEPTTVFLDLHLDHFEHRDPKVIVPEKALRKLAEWAGFALTPVPPGKE